MDLTTHLLINNDRDTIEDSIKSAIKLGGQILVGDLGSSDGTVAICHKFGAIVVPFPAADNHSEVRNQLLSMSKTGWNFSLQPWEIIIAGHDLIKNMVETSGCATYRMQVLRGQVITKEIR